MKVASESNTCAPARVDKDQSLLQQKNKQCSLKMKRLHNPKSFFHKMPKYCWGYGSWKQPQPNQIWKTKNF
jgi:hypothetical protein